MRGAQVSYHTHIPEYIPKYTWKGLVGPMWRVIRFNILMADLTLVPSKTMKARLCTPSQLHPLAAPAYQRLSPSARVSLTSRQRAEQGVLRKLLTAGPGFTPVTWCAGSQSEILVRCAV
jgi:hypothetical protein